MGSQRLRISYLCYLGGSSICLSVADIMIFSFIPLEESVRIVSFFMAE